MNNSSVSARWVAVVVLLLPIVSSASIFDPLGQSYDLNAVIKQVAQPVQAHAVAAAIGAAATPLSPALIQSSLSVAKVETLGVVPFGINAQGQQLAFRIQAGMLTTTDTDQNVWASFQTCAATFTADANDLARLLDTYVSSPADRLKALPDNLTARNDELARRDLAAQAATAAAFTLFQGKLTAEISSCLTSAHVKALAPALPQTAGTKLPTPYVLPVISIGLRSVLCIVGSAGCTLSNGAQERFEKLGRLYAISNQMVALKDWAHPNDWVQVKPTGDIAKYDKIAIDGTKTLPLALTQDEALAALNNEVLKLRKLKVPDPSKLLSPLVSALAGLTPGDALHLSDVFASPLGAYNVAVGTVDKLNGVSDEIARLRITECARFDAKRTVADVAACAGYTLPDDKVLVDCLNGGECLPPITAGQVQAQIAMLAERVDLRALATTVDLPRLLNPNIQFPAFEAAGLACAKANKTDAAAMATCLAKAQFPDAKVQAVLDCAQNGRDGVASCLNTAISAVDPKTAAMAKCMLNQSMKPTERLACAALQQTDANTAEVLNCALAANTKNAMAKCVANVSPAVQQALAVGDCTKPDANGNSPDTLAAGLCMAQAVGHFDHDTSAAITCLQQNPSDYEASLGCYAAGKIGGTAGVILKCAASSGGDYMATAVCAAGPKLTAEQQIALSCAVTASTGPGYAVCVGGRLAFKEWTQCQNAHFGDGACFGDNNEFRKFAKNVLGTPIGSNSVVAQYINFNLDAVKGTISIAEGTVKMFDKAARDIGDAVNNVPRGISDAARTIQSLADATPVGQGLQAAIAAPLPQITVRPNEISVNQGPIQAGVGPSGAQVSVGGNNGVGVSIGGGGVHGHVGPVHF